ncbi:FecR family protein [Proteiniphilum sp. UBA1028]|jgi:ferric-dicitrate binding protein FerR (iron transport regulator)|uniref:FecR family protein n=1 Tax=Proteiniphilum sp. UBA1028 TaxID=1947251 RepID=UPI000ECDE41E|nr:FecR family protein [Proteiniphilum sp. UBA1028]HCF80345.1 anti-sigma factor [Porphyromonadaceae bacterium]
MDRELLYRFFEGKTSIDEEKVIRQWLDQSVVNEKTFIEERKTYDALLFTSREVVSKQKRLPESTPWIISAVAAVVLLLIVGGLYLFNNNNYPEQYNTILVPPGQRINLILADNSNVWLNANTTFRYPSQFSKKYRTVYLDGEAYFAVSKNEKKPFIVKTSLGDVQVTGTAFNVEAYSQFNHFETSLFEGGVDVFKEGIKLTSLKPNEKATFQNNNLVISEIINTDKYLWRQGLIAFNDTKLDEILLSLEKYFDVDIHIDSKSLPQHTYTGKFRQSDGVDYALRVLQKSIHFTYVRDDHTGKIYIK